MLLFCKMMSSCFQLDWWIGGCEELDDKMGETNKTLPLGTSHDATRSFVLEISIVGVDAGSLSVGKRLKN